MSEVGQLRTTESTPSVSPSIITNPDFDRHLVAFKELCEGLKGLFDEKSREYNRVTSLSTYYPYNEQSIASAVHEKTMRLHNLAGSGESLEDTLKDLAVVAIMGMIYLQDRDT